MLGFWDILGILGILFGFYYFFYKHLYNDLIEFEVRIFDLEDQISDFWDEDVDCDQEHEP